MVDCLASDDCLLAWQSREQESSACTAEVQILVPCHKSGKTVTWRCQAPLMQQTVQEKQARQCSVQIRRQAQLPYR